MRRVPVGTSDRRGTRALSRLPKHQTREVAKMVISRASAAGAATACMLAIALVSSPLAAQNIGDRVRVFSGGTTTIGEVTAVSSEGFDLLGRGKRQSFSYGQIYRLERSLGARHLWKKGLAYGAGGGVALGLLLGVFQASACDWLTLGLLTGECAEHGLRGAVVAGVNVGAVGGVLGMAIGALMRRESWTPISIAGRRFTVSSLVGPVGRGVDGSGDSTRTSKSRLSVGEPAGTAGYAPAARNLRYSRNEMSFLRPSSQSARRRVFSPSHIVIVGAFHRSGFSSWQRCSR